MVAIMSGRAGAKKTHDSGELLSSADAFYKRCVCFYILCTSIHQHIEPTVVCVEFVTWIVVLLLMPKD